MKTEMRQVQNANTADAKFNLPEVPIQRKKKKIGKVLNFMMTIFLLICVIVCAAAIYNHYSLYKTFEPVLVVMLLLALAFFPWYFKNLITKTETGPKDANGKLLQPGDMVIYNYYPIYTAFEKRKGVIVSFETVGKFAKQYLCTIRPEIGNDFKEFPEKIQKF